MQQTCEVPVELIAALEALRDLSIAMVTPRPWGSGSGPTGDQRKEAWNVIGKVNELLAEVRVP